MPSTSDPEMGRERDSSKLLIFSSPREHTIPNSARVTGTLAPVVFIPLARHVRVSLSTTGARIEAN